MLYHAPRLQHIVIQIEATVLAEKNFAARCEVLLHDHFRGAQFDERAVCCCCRNMHRRELSERHSRSQPGPKVSDAYGQHALQGCRVIDQHTPVDVGA